MAKLSILAGATSVSVNIFVQDSSKTDGSGLTGLVFNTASLVAYYALPRAASAQITLATLAAVTSAYSSGGFKEIDATNMKGLYRLDIPNAALASGRFSTIYLSGATNMAPCVLEIELTATDNQNATTFGLTNLDAAISSRSTYAGGAVASVTGAVGSVTGAVGSVTAAVSVSGDLSATMKTSVTTACTAATPNVGGYQSGQDPATLVLDVAASGHNTAGTIGQKINAAGGAADPLTNAVPGAYGAGTAGNVLGNFAPIMLKYDTSLIAGEAANCILNYLRALRRVSIDDTSGVVTVFKEDGTVAWTAQGTFDTGARPLSRIT